MNNNENIIYRINFKTKIEFQTINNENKNNPFNNNYNLNKEDIITNITQNFGGYEDSIREAVGVMLLAFTHSENSQIKRPQGILVHGTSGTGKSLLIKLLAESFHCQIKTIHPNILTRK